MTSIVHDDPGLCIAYQSWQKLLWTARADIKLIHPPSPRFIVESLYIG
jgi:hypothetical protein